MKTLISLIVLFCLISINSKAQVPTPTKLHFLNASVGLSIPEIRTEIDQKKAILLKSRTWVTIQTVGDSISLIINNKPYPLYFEANKQYYFIIQSTYSSRLVITEKSEREFTLTAAIESVKGQELYVLDQGNN